METLFPHHLGHYIGLDVHDSVGYSRKTILQAGQCVTMEPYAQDFCILRNANMLTPSRGLYIPDDDRWPEAFRGIGIRIEDSVCVQDDGPFVLTTEAVKEVRVLAA